MADKFTSALLAALNESAEINESDWNAIEPVPRAPIDPVEVELHAAGPLVSENRFAATISSVMAKIRSGG